MPNNEEIRRIYDIAVVGFTGALENIQALTQAIQNADEAKKKLNTQLNTKIENGVDSVVISELSKQVGILSVNLEKLVTDRSAAIKEALELAKAEKIATDATVASDQALQRALKTQQQKLQLEITELRLEAAKEAAAKRSAAASQKQADADEKEILLYETLAQRRRALTILLEQAVNLKQPIVNFEGDDLTIKETIAAIEQLKIAEEEYQALIKSGARTSLITQEQQEIEKQKALRLNIVETTEAYELQGRRLIALNEAIAASKKTTIAPFSPQLGVNFEGQNIQLREAEALETRISAEQVLQQERLSVLNTEQIELNQTLEKERSIRLSNIEVEENSLRQLEARLKDLNTRISSVDITKQSSTVNFENETVTATRALELRKEINAAIDVQKQKVQIATESEQGSLNVLKQERAELKALVDSRAQSNFTTVDFKGQTISVSNAEEKLRTYSVTIAEIEQRQKTLKLNTDLADTGIVKLSNDTKVLIDVAKRMSDGTSLTSQEIRALSTTLTQTDSSLSHFTNEEFRNGTALDTVRAKIIQNVTEINAFNSSIKASQVQIKEYSLATANAFKNLGLTNVLTDDRNKLVSDLNAILIRVRELTEAYNQTKAAGGAAFAAIDAELRQAVAEHTRLAGSLGNVNTALNGTQSTATTVTNSISNGFANVERSIKQVAVTYLGLQAAIGAVSGIVRLNEELSDQAADLQRVLGTTADATEKVVQGLREINTRTGITELTGFAIIAARAGVATEKITGVVEAINRLKLTAGNELGDVDHAFSSIVKIINIFEGEGKVNQETVSKFSNALVTLANESVATGGFLVEFTNRLSGVAGVSKIQIESVLGLASAFENTGQTAEVSASAIIQIINRLGTDIVKYAGLANGVKDITLVTDEQIKEFKTLIDTDPGAALLKLAVGLKGSGEGFSDLSKNFADLQARGIRVTSIFEDMASRSDFFKNSIISAHDALGNMTQLMEGSELKEKTFAGTIADIGKQFQLAFTNKSFLDFLSSAANAVLFFVKAVTSIPFGLIIGGITAMTSVWAYFKGVQAAAYIQQNLNNTSTLIGYTRSLLARTGILGESAALQVKIAQERVAIASKAALLAEMNAELVAREAELALLYQSTVATGAYIASVEAEVVALQAEIIAVEEASVATGVFNTVVGLSPFGIVIGLLAVAIPLIALFTNKTKESTASQNALSDAAKRASKEYDDQAAKVRNLDDSLTPLIGKYDEISKKNVRSTEEQKQLKDIINQVIKIMPDAVTGWDNLGNAIGISTNKVREFINAEKARLQYVNQDSISANKKALGDVNKQIEAQQKLEDARLAGTLSFTTEQLIDKNTGLPIGIEIKRAATQDEKNAVATKTQALLQKKLGIETEINRLTGAILDKQELQAKTAAIESEVDVTALSKDEAIDALKAQKARIDASIKSQIELIKSTEIAGKNTEDLSSRLKALRALRSKVEADLRDLLGPKPTGGSRVYTSFQQTDLNLIDAERDRQLALEKLRFIKLEEAHKADVAAELQHQLNLQSIDDEFDNKKIAATQVLLSKTEALEKGATGHRLDQLKLDASRETEEIAKLQLGIIQRHLDTNEKIFASDKKRLDEQRNLAVQAAQTQLNVILDTPGETDTEKVYAREQFYRILIGIQSRYAISARILQEQSGKTDVEAQKKNDQAVLDAINNLNKLRLQEFEAFISDSNRIFEAATKEIETKFENIRAKFSAASTSAPQVDRFNQASKLAQAVEEATLDLQKALAQQERAFLDANLVLKDGTTKLTEEEYKKYQEAVAQAKEKLEETLKDLGTKTGQISNIQDAAKEALRKLLGLNKVDTTASAEDQTKQITKNAAQTQLLAETISQAYDVAMNAMQNYFDAEHDAIQRSLEVQQKRIDIETQQRKDRAQSQAEADFYEREGAATKDKLAREAFEKDKKLKKEQAAINLGIQLSNLAVAASEIDAVTFGIGGPIYYAIQAALAIFNYLSNVGRINSSTYEYGGNVGGTKGGRVGGNRHSDGGNPFKFKGRVFEDEVDELHVIRTKNAPAHGKYTITGSQEEIASALNQIGGGVVFKPGAQVIKFDYGGVVPNSNWGKGSSVFSLRPPDNPSLLLSSNINSMIITLADRVDKQTSNINALAYQANTRIDNLKVYNVATETTKKSDDIKKASNMGSIL